MKYTIMHLEKELNKKAATKLKKKNNNNIQMVKVASSKTNLLTEEE